MKVKTSSVLKCFSTALLVSCWISLRLLVVVSVDRDRKDDTYSIDSIIGIRMPKTSQQSDHQNSTTYQDYINAYKEFPILPDYQPSHHPDHPVRIRVLAFKHDVNRHAPILFRKGPDAAFSDELVNIVMDGFHKSAHFEIVDATIVPDFKSSPDFVLKEDEDIVWVADMRRIVYKADYTIGVQLADAVNKTRQYQLKKFAASGRNIPSLHVVLMDYRDKIPEKTLCTNGAKQVLETLGPGHIRSVLQQVVRKRAWDTTQNFCQPGVYWDARQDAKCFQRPTLHAPYTLRSDYVDAVHAVYTQYLPDCADGSTCTGLSPVDTIRPIDVAHFWSTALYEDYARLRDGVTRTVLSLANATVRANTSNPSSSRRIHVVGDFVSSGGKVGRVNVADEYVKALLTTKIVVVAQRDNWEDHYRLFEAYAGGSMVMSDTMLSLPDGLVDGESIVIYNSLDELRSQILYYLEHEDKRLEIARRGFEIAIKQHRSYHWMEKIFFGKQLTP